MAKSSGQKRAQGGGRTPNSEPRIQLFKDFTGMNFQNANRLDGRIDVDDDRHDPGDQTDLQMTYVFLQNNVMVASNKTFETRDDIVTLFDAPDGADFTGPTCLIGHGLYVAKDDQNIAIVSLEDRAQVTRPIVADTNVQLWDKTGSGHHWTSLDHYDDKLIALTAEDELWTGDVDNYLVEDLSNAAYVEDPPSNIYASAKGDLELWPSMNDDHPFRVSYCHTYVNKYGPTLPSPMVTIFTNHPVSEWHSGCYLNMSGIVPKDNGIIAVELYYTTDNAMEPIFLDRVDIGPDAELDGNGNPKWEYNWYGYIDATSMWPIANLIVPTENYTTGVPASRVTNIDGRLYFWGSTDFPYRLYMGGNPGNLLSVSPGTGGGFVDVEPGTNQEVRYVCKYKTQSGNSIVTMLCDSPNSMNEQRFNLVENSIALSNEQSMKSWQAEQVAGAVGCKSYDGAVVCQDGLYSVSRYGLALTTMTMEYNSQIRTNYVSDSIKPVFVDAAAKETRLSKAILLECDGVIYMAIGASADKEEPYLDNVLFCYDIDLKAWWSYTLDVDSPILKLFHVDWQGQREGIGIVTKRHIYLLPTTVGDDCSTNADHGFLIETAQISTQMPQQGWQYLSQLEFHFDHFIGDALIHVRMVDMFGRELHVKRSLHEEDEKFDYVVRMRIDQRIMSYVITMTGQARFRMTHFLARVYTMSNKVGQVWGFNDSISYRSAGDVQPAFKCYNDVRRAIFT